MNTEPPVITKPPGILWIVLLGVIGFCAGFFGPLVFVPEANQGPLVGIFLTGPGGTVLGLLLFLLMKFRPLSGRNQWILLTILAVAGTLTTFYFIQPQPATRDYELELTLERTCPPGEAADAVIADWKQRIAQVTWATPRASWEPQMGEQKGSGWASPRTLIPEDSGRSITYLAGGGSGMRSPLAS